MQNYKIFRKKQYFCKMENSTLASCCCKKKNYYSKYL